MAKVNIKYTWDSLNDLDSIFDYISEDNKSAAAKMLEKLEKTILITPLLQNPRTYNLHFKSFAYKARLDAFNI